MKDSRELREFVEQFAMLMEQSGLTRTKGRIIGYLTICEPLLQTLDAIADFLNLGVSTVSPELKQLVDLGIVERLKRRDVPQIPGERGYLFFIKEETWTQTIDAKNMMYVQAIELFSKGLKLMEGQSRERKRRLADLKLLFEFMQVEMPKLMDKYRRYKQERVDQLE